MTPHPERIAPELDAAQPAARVALARWIHARTQWEASNCRIDDWEQTEMRLCRLKGIGQQGQACDPERSEEPVLQVTDSSQLL